MFVPLLPDTPGAAHDAFYLSLVLCPKRETTGEAQVSLRSTLEPAGASVDEAELVAVLRALRQSHDFGIRQNRGRTRHPLGRVWVVPSENLIKLVGCVLGLTDWGVADDVAGHGKEPPGAVELALDPVRALRDFGFADDVKAVPGRRALCVGVEAVYPPTGLLFCNVVYIDATVRAVRMEDEAYAVKDAVLLVGLQGAIKGCPGGRIRGGGPALPLT